MDVVFLPSSSLALSRMMMVLLGRTTSVEPSAMPTRARPLASVCTVSPG